MSTRYYEPMDTSECISSYRGKIAPNNIDFNKLPLELKTIVIKQLSFPDKQNMMLVNWECLKICQSLPNKLTELGIAEVPSTAKTNLIMKWKNPKGRVVSRMVEYRGMNMRQRECPDYTAEAMKVFLRLWRLSKVKNVVIEIPCFEGLTTMWDDHIKQNTSNIAVRCFNIRTNDYRLVTSALQAVRNSKLEISLLANDYGGMDTSIFDIDKVKQARSMILWSLISNIDDNQLLSLSAHNIRITSSNITSNGIARMIQEWQNGRRKLERLHISSPNINLEEVVQQLECVGWKELTDICKVVWREVDEEGYSYAARGPQVDMPAAIGLVTSERTPTFIFRIIKMTHTMSQLLTERCGHKCDRSKRIEQVAR